MTLDDVDAEAWRRRLFDGDAESPHRHPHRHYVASPPGVDGELQDDELDTEIDAEELVRELEAQADLETDGGQVLDRQPGGRDLGLPDEIASIIPDRKVSLEARDVLEDLPVGRPAVERVLEVARHTRPMDDVSIQDLLSVLEHSGGLLALVTYGNTGVTVATWVNLGQFGFWTYSAVDEQLGRESTGFEEIRTAEAKRRLEFATPSIVVREATPLAGGELG